MSSLWINYQCRLPLYFIFGHLLGISISFIEPFFPVLPTQRSFILLVYTLLRNMILNDYPQRFHIFHRSSSSIGVLLLHYYYQNNTCGTDSHAAADTVVRFVNRFRSPPDPDAPSSYHRRRNCLFRYGCARWFRRRPEHTALGTGRTHTVCTAPIYAAIVTFRLNCSVRWPL